MLPYDLPVPDDHNLVRIHPDLNRSTYLGAMNTVAIAIKSDQRTGTDTGRTLRISVKGKLYGDQAPSFLFVDLPHRLILNRWMFACLGPPNTPAQ